MHRVPIASRTIKAIAFDPRTHTLEIEFFSGHIYDFADVPQHVYDELMHAPSKAKYFHEHIREHYTFVRLGDIALADVRDEAREDALLGDDDVVDAEDVPEPSPAATVMSAAAPRVRAGHDTSSHTWIVDVIDGDSAAIQVDGREVTSLPRWLLPADAAVNDLLRVSHFRSGDESRVTIEIARSGARG
jgi:KTSC domain-containing protein